MNLDDPVWSDEGISISLSTISGPRFGDFLDSESSVTMTMIDTPPLSLELNQVNAPSYSHPSDGLPPKLLSNHDVHHNSSQELQDVYKQTLGSGIYTSISSSTQQSTEDYSMSERSRYNVDSSINPSVCVTTDDAVARQTMGQHMPNYSPSGHQPTDVGNSLVSSIPSLSNVYSGLLADAVDDLQSKVPDIQHHPTLSSLPGPLLAHFTINHTITDDHEPSLLPPEILASSEGTSDDCLQSIMIPYLPERRAVLSRSLLLKSSHASRNDNDNDTLESGSELVTNKSLTSHAENFECSHKNTPIVFAPDHFSTSRIDHSEESHPFLAPSPDSAMQDMNIEDLNSSPPSSPSMSSAYIRSSSPIPSSSPVEPSFQTPPTSPPSSPAKSTQLEIGSSSIDLLILNNHELKNFSVDGYTEIPLSGFADQPIKSVISPDRSTLPLQPQTSRVANSSNTSATVALSNDVTTNTEGEAGPLNESYVEQKKLDSNVDTHRLKSMNGIPYPKRSSIAAHRLQQKKLARPFRSPVLPQASKVEFKPKASATDLRGDAVLSCSPTPKEGNNQEHVSSSSTTLDSRIKYRTTRAATQFKSPLSAPNNVLNDSSLVRLTPTIQALERKLQILKRAVKVREDVQEEVLEGLVKKWTEAGREVAWEVWNLVKDNASFDGGHGNSRSSKRAFQGSWGWESPGDAKKPRGEEMERNWGWDVVPISSRGEEEEEAPKHTLGTMLMQLGVAPDTLGWNDDEGSFI